MPNEKQLDECAEPNPIQDDIVTDRSPEECQPFPDDPSLKDVSFLGDLSRKKKGIGVERQCDPMQTGQIAQDLRKEPSRNTIYRHAKALRGCNEAVKDLFSNVIVEDEQGKEHPVPIRWGSQEKAVAFVIQSNVRKDNSAVVDRIILPIMSINHMDVSYSQERYTYHKALDYFRRCSEDRKPGFYFKEKRDRDTVFGVARGIPVDVSYQLNIWTLYQTDADQIIEQIITKFSPIAYIKIQGVLWPTIVRIDSVSDNRNWEPGDQDIRVIKYQFNMTAETYIPQPIRREKTVLEEKIDILDGISEKEIKEVIDRLSIGIEDLDD